MNELEPITFPLPSSFVLQAALDAIKEPIFVKDREHRWIACNQAFCALLGQPYAAVIGCSDPDYFSPEQAAEFWRADNVVFHTKQPLINEEVITSATGVTSTIYTRKYPLLDPQGNIIGLAGLITDISEIKQRQQQIDQLARNLAEQEATVEHQRLLIEQVAVPVIQVWERVLLLPLIGIVDSYRASRITESVLAAVAHASAEVLILDITGVPLVDTTVASHLMQGIQAAQLLGCQSILVGISPHIAQTLVELGVDFSHITTQATLQQGLLSALKLLNYTVSHDRHHP